MELFYTDSLINNQIILNPEESWHCIKVKRFKINDEIDITDGKGGLYKAIIEQDNPKQVIAIINRVVEYTKIQKPYITLAIAPPKHPDRFEWLIEKVTELGVDNIIPLVCERSERIKFKFDRLHRIIVAASKQSLRYQFPIINELHNYNEFFKLKMPSSLFIAHCEPNKKPSLNQVLNPNNDALILIGPEGDFTKNEINLALQHQFLEINLGKYRLRTETAAIHAVSAIMTLNGIEL